jgi:glutamyl-tRNA synthetase
MKDATRKLSKRYGDANFDDFINKGYIEEAIINYVALLGWCPKNNAEKMTIPEMIELFDLSGISKSPSIFDDVKLRWLNGEYLKAMSDDEFLTRAKPFFEKSEVSKLYDISKIAKIIKSRIEILSDIPEKVSFLVERPSFDSALYENKKQKTDASVAKQVLPSVLTALSEIEDFSNDNLFRALSSLSETLSIKSRQLFYVLRIALTGLEVTPGGATEILEILGKEESVKRVKSAIELL